MYWSGYNAVTIGGYIVEHDLRVSDKFAFLEKVFKEENKFILNKYQNNKRLFYTEVMYWINCYYYITDSECSKNHISIDKYENNESLLLSELNDMEKIDYFFQKLRLYMKFDSKNGYTRLKLKTLLQKYGYKRRSNKIVSYMEEQLKFYQIMVTYHGNESTLWDVDMDAMLTFRLVD